MQLQNSNAKHSSDNYVGLILESDRDRTCSISSTMSPTFTKECCIKPEEGSLSSGSASIISPLPSFEDSVVNVSIASTSSWQTTTQTTDKRLLNLNLLGLPTAYPSHEKSASWTSTTLEEELQDFEIFDEETVEKSPISTSERVSPEDNPLRFNDSASSIRTSSSSNTCSTRRRSRHRRQRTEIGSITDFVEIAKTSRERRRGRNHAMGPVDFHEQILTKLFDDCSLDSLRL